MHQRLQFGNSPCKMIVSGLVSAFVFISTVVASQIAPGAKIPNVYSFEKVERLALGSSQDRALAAFGRPSKIYRKSSNGEVAWIYFEGKDILRRTQRLGLSFSAGNLTLIGVVYEPDPLDTIYKFEGLLAHFPNAHIRTVEPSSCGQHYQANDGYSYDDALGISFQRDRSNNVFHFSITKPLPKAERVAAAAERTGCEDFGKLESFEEITPALR